MNVTTNATPPVIPGPNEPCWCGTGTKYKKCHKSADDAEIRRQKGTEASRRVRPGEITPRRPVPAHIPRPDYADTGKPAQRQHVAPMSGERLERMRRACQAAARVLQKTGVAVRPGITTDELDRIAHEAYVAEGGYPSTLNYKGFRKSICTSVNEVVCHGIPDSRPLDDGDIVNVDVTIFLDGMHGDTSATFLVGNVDEAGRKLVRVTEECLQLGIAAVAPGKTVRAIGQAIEPHARAHGFGVIRAYAGHGIGETFHTPLQIPHYDEPEATEELVPGMVFTIEPMLTEGDWRIRHWNDGWTVVTADARRSAQFEHTVVVTETGVEILTRP